MNKLYIFLISSLLIVSSGVIAAETELLDSYLIDLPTSTQQPESSPIVDQQVDIVVNENRQTRKVVQPQAVEYRSVKTADGDVYQEVHIQSVDSSSNTTTTTDMLMNNQDLEVIELEPEGGEVTVIEAPKNQTKQRAITNNTTTNRAATTGHSFCQQNPSARECLLSRYLILCQQDPQSTDCKSELEKFDNFCGTFPSAYKCKKAKVAASCQKNPGSEACKTFNQRYCQKYPKAIFCNYN